MLRRIVSWTIIAICITASALPLLPVVLGTALSGPSMANGVNFSLDLSSKNLVENFSYLFGASYNGENLTSLNDPENVKRLYESIFDTLIVSFSAAFIALLTSITLCGYWLCNQLKIRSNTKLLSLLWYMLPTMILVFPLGLLATELSIRQLISPTTLLVLAHSLFLFPLTLYLVAASFDTLPYQLRDSLLMDDRGTLVSLWQVIIPCCSKDIFVAAVIALSISINDIAFSRYLVQHDSLLVDTFSIMILEDQSDMIPYGIASAFSLVFMMVAIFSFALIASRVFREEAYD